MFTNLFSPLAVGPVTIRNRVVSSGHDTRGVLRDLQPQQAAHDDGEQQDHDDPEPDQDPLDPAHDVLPPTTDQHGPYSRRSGGMGR